MKMKMIAAACALMAAGSSFAAGTVSIGGVPHNVVYLSGASAPDNFLADIAEGMLTGVTFYTASGTNYRAFAGAANNIPNVANGTRVLFIKRSAGGSVFGVNPVARAQRVTTINVNNCTGTGTGTKGNPFTCAVVGTDPGEPNHALPANAGLVPDFGVSDVEPAMFQDPFNTENDAPALAPAEVARLSVTPLNQIMMGIAATNQVPATTVLTRSAYGAMLNGQITTWDQVDPTLSGDVAVCRRVEGSGTQTSYNWFFGNFPCSANEFGSVAPARMTDSFGWKATGTGTVADPYEIDPSAGYTVVENSSSSNVRSCMTAANNGTDYNFAAFDPEEGKTNNFRVTFTKSGPMKAIGVVSLDSYASTSGWSFRHLDGAGTFTGGTQTSSAGATGIAPSKANLINGRYDFVVELSIQGRNVAVTNEQGDVVAAAGGVQQAFATEFTRRAGSPQFTGNFDNSGAQVSTPFAFASLPQNFAGLTNSNGAETDGNGVRFADLYVSKYSRNANTCSPLRYIGN
jgi:ABC-type phosphate transport system substrate-binding protein